VERRARFDLAAGVMPAICSYLIRSDAELQLFFSQVQGRIERQR
jgi:hypothetical protein